MLSKSATNRVNFIGAINGELTPVAIIELPLGKIDISGDATKEYISEAKGNPIMVRTPIQINVLINLDLSSIKCDDTELLFIFLFLLKAF